MSEKLALSPFILCALRASAVKSFAVSYIFQGAIQ